MANNFVISNALAVLGLDAIADGFDSGTAAVINIYDGAQPADVSVAISTQTLLAQLTMSATAFGAASDDTPGAIVTAAAITSDSSADNTGTAAWFRILTQSGGTALADGTVGTSGADLNMNTVAITAGSTVAISSFTMILPEGPGLP